MIPNIFVSDKRPYYTALRKPRNKKSGKRLYVNQIHRSLQKEALATFKREVKRNNVKLAN